MEAFELASKIKVPSKQWSAKEVTQWINLIDLPDVAQRLEGLNIGGKQLSLLSDKDLRQQLGIQSLIVRKKLLNWIHAGFKDFDVYLEQFKQEQSQKSPMALLIQEPQKRTVLICDLQHKDSVRRIAVLNNVSIGRHSSSSIIINQETISRKHATITYNNQNYFYIDNASTSGSFVLLKQRSPLTAESKFKAGEQFFEVISISQGEVQVRCSNKVQEKVARVDLRKREGASFGRRRKGSMVHFSFQDNFLSNQHFRIYASQSTPFLQDMGSTNGTWLMLTPHHSLPLHGALSLRLGGSVLLVLRVGEVEGSGERVVVWECGHLGWRQSASCLSCGKKEIKFQYIASK